MLQDSSGGQQMQTGGRGLAAKAVLASMVTAAVLLGAHYGPLFYSESRGRPLPYLWALIKLELLGSDLVAVAPDQTLLLQKGCPEPMHKPLTASLAARGWTYRDQMGAGILYEKGSTRLTATSRMFSRRYVVYKLHQAP